MKRSLTVLVASLAVLAACGGDDVEEAAVVTEASTPSDTKAKRETTAVTETTAEETAPSSVAVPIDSDDAAGFPFAGPDGDYVVRFDDEPQTQVQEAPLPDGSTLEVTIYFDLDDEGTFFGINAVDYGTAVAVSPEELRDGAIANAPGASLVDSQDLELQGRRGLQYIGDVNDGQGDLIGRIYVDGSRLYHLAVAGVDLTPDDPEVAAFFESFEFTEG